MTRGPDFLLIGAAKSGTTALYRALKAHPQIFLPDNKEPQFFAFPPGPVSFGGPRDHERHSRTITDETAYQRLFADRLPGQMAGEASTHYLYSTAAPGRIRSSLPHVRLLVILREPARRAYANYLHLVRQGFETAPTFEDGLAEEAGRIAAGWDFFWRYRDLGYYHRQLSRYYELFDRDRIKVLLHHDFERDPYHVVRSVYAFLGVDAAFRPELSRRVNPSGVPRAPRLHQLLAAPPPAISRWARAWLPADRRHRIAEAITRVNLRRPAVPEAALRRLRPGYRSDLAALERLTGLDLSAWLGDQRPVAPGAREGEAGPAD